MAFNPTLRHLTTRLDGGVVWAASTEYLADNVVIYLDASYRCLVNHTAGSSFVTDLLANKWVKLSASEINYIANSSALVDTSGYSAYADAAGAAPVDGSGGSPSVTFSRSTTSPLRGIADFNFTKPAGASHQGNGVSYDFTIDNADLAKVLTVTFDYEVVSGTYADGDLTVYIIQDPTGTPVVIQPAGYTIMAGTVGTKLREIATFQTASNVTSYRLCFHCASSTNTNAYVIAMDNISVSPQSTVQGAAISDWQSFTPVGISGFSSAPTVNIAKYRRVGGNIEVHYKLILTGPTNDFLRFPIPSGFTIDTTNGTVLGYAVFYDTTGNQSYSGLCVEDSGNKVVISLPSGAGPYWNGSLNLPFAGSAAGDFIFVNFSAPIVGLSSNTVLSQDTDTRVIATRATAALPTGTIASTFAGSTAAVFSGTSYDLSGSYSTSTGAFTIPVSGVYKVSASTRLSGTLAAGSTFSAIALTKNGVEYSNIGLTFSTSTGAGTLNSFGSDAVSCVAGDIITIRVVSNATTPIFTSDSTKNFLEISRLSGPATIAASESVIASAQRTTADGSQSYSTTAGQTFRHFTDYFPTDNVDTHGMLTNTASETYATIPVSGVYEISRMCRYSASSVTLTIQNYIMLGGTNQTNTITMDGTVLSSAISTNVTVSDGDTIVVSYTGRLNAGDIIRFKCIKYGDTNMVMLGSSTSQISIKRVGN